MKFSRKIYKWVILSIIIQLIVLAYIDKFLSSDGDIQFVTTNVTENINLNDNNGVKIPEGGYDVKLSFDQGYVSYMYDNKFHIVNMNTGELDKAFGVTKKVVNFYKWLPDRNIIIYSELVEAAGKYSIQISTYDVVSGNSKSYPKITNAITKQTEVQDINLSSLTNIVYVKIKVNDSTSHVYRFDIMEHMRFIMALEADSTIKETNYSDDLIYQNNQGKIYSRSGTKGTTTTLKIDFPAKLIGVDLEDLIYITELDKNNNAAKIYYGKQDSINKLNKKEFVLPKKVELNSILITGDGGVYVVDETAGSVYDCIAKKNIQYKGEFVAITKETMVTRNYDKLILTKR